MKKFLFSTMLMIAFLGHSIQVKAELTTAAAIAIINCGIEVYKNIPDAKYYLMVVGDDGSIAYAAASSCDVALAYAYNILDTNSDVRRVTIVSEYRTVNCSCQNNDYYHSDLENLRELRRRYNNCW